MAYKTGDRVANDLPLNLQFRADGPNPNYDPTRPERVRVPGIVISDEVRVENRTGRNGNSFPVRLVNVISLRTRLADGGEWLHEGWEPETFTFVRGNPPVVGLDCLADGTALTIFDLQVARSNQPGPTAVIAPRMAVAPTVFTAPAAAIPATEDRDADDLDEAFGTVPAKASRKAATA